VASLGGPPTPAVGFGLGLERFLMMVDAASGAAAEPRRGIQAIALGAAARERLVPLAGRLRAATDVPVFIDYGERKLTAHFKLADRNRARWALILGDNELAQDEIVMRDLEQRAERRLPLSDAVSRVAQFVVEGTSDA